LYPQIISEGNQTNENYFELSSLNKDVKGNKNERPQNLQLNHSFNNIIQNNNVNNQSLQGDDSSKMNDKYIMSKAFQSKYQDSRRKELATQPSFLQEERGNLNQLNHLNQISTISKLVPDINSEKPKNNNIISNKNQVIYEGIVSKFHKNGFSDVFIPRFCRLSNSYFEIFKEKCSADIKKYPPLLLIPIKIMKSVERIKIIKEKNLKEIKRRKKYIFAIFIFEDSNIHHINSQNSYKLDYQSTQTISPKMILQRSLSVFQSPIKSFDILRLSTTPHYQYQIKLAKFDSNLSTSGKLSAKKASIYFPQEKINDENNINFLERNNIIFLQDKKDLNCFKNFFEDKGIQILKTKRKISNFQQLNCKRIVKSNILRRKNMEEDITKNYYIFSVNSKQECHNWILLLNWLIQKQHMREITLKFFK